MKNMNKDIIEYKVGDFVFWKSYEGFKKYGSGKVIDAWKNQKGKPYLTAKNSYQTVCLSAGDLA